MTKYCPVCGKIIADYMRYCPNCHTHLPSGQISIDHHDTSKSGESYVVSSGAYISSQFTKIADKFDANPNSDIVTIDISGDKIDKYSLDYYVKIGYLERLPGNKYKLTDLGKEAFLKNRKFQEKVEEKTEEIKFDD